MIRASQILFWFGLSIAASLALYHTSDRTRELESQLRTLDAAIDNERENIHVLKAEWVYLANPARVEAEAKKHLALRPTPPKDVISLAALNDVLPTRAEAMGSVTVSSAPIANVEASYIPEPPPLPARKTASADHGHINNRMTIGSKPTRTASAAPGDQIGGLINRLGTRP
jgi:cell division protein FtsL